MTSPYCLRGRNRGHGHHWLIASPNGGDTMPARCIFCGARRTFPHYVEMRGDEGAMMTGEEVTAISAARRQWRHDEYGQPEW